LHSALGRHDDPHRCLAFAKASTRVMNRTGHLQLLRSAAVLEQMHDWLR
jgi:hypothetical protein